MNDTATFLNALGDVPCVSDPEQVRRRSRDMTANFSPVLKDDALAHHADLIVKPRDKADVLRIASAAARSRMPLVMRGGGSANFGQGIPLAGGAVVDMTGLSSIVRVQGQRVRAEAGARLGAIDEALRPTGWELRMHPSTRKVATLGGFVGGGHAGIGSCTYGILRDRGNILGLQVVSVEEEPRVVELGIDEVNRVHHAYGSNGIVTELEMPLAPAWPWTEAIVVLPTFMTAVRLAHALACADGIVKKLISVIGEPIWQKMGSLATHAPAGSSLVLAMIAEPLIDAFRSLVREFGGTVTCEAPEGRGPYRIPLYEMTWGHTRLQVNRQHPELIGAVGLYVDPDLVGAIERSHRRFGPAWGLHFEVKRFDGRLSFQGSPFFPFEGEAQLAAVMDGMAEDGAMVANNHTFLVRQGGMKSVDAGDLAFKRAMDPYDLMNPGKLRFEDAAAGPAAPAAGADLPSAGWRYDATGPGDDRPAR